MARPALLLALVGCVVVAGCAGSAPPAASGGETPVSESPPRDVDAASDRVWPDEPIVVGLAGDPDRDYGPQIRAALDYWAANAATYVGYDVEFVYAPAASDPDVEVAFADRIADCQGISDPVGCAPLVTERGQIDRPVTVTVRTGLTDDSTALVLRHELGHVLGLDHGDAPEDVMRHETPVATLPQPNATDRALPWNDSTLSVYVDYESVRPDDRGTVRDQVARALAYYADGADGTVPANLSFTLVGDPETADVVVRFPEETTCGTGSGSCGVRYGVDPDRDDAFERYTRLEISLTGIDPAATGWHVAYWLGYGLGFEDDDEWPAPLRNGSGTTRQGEWWAE